MTPEKTDTMQPLCPFRAGDWVIYTPTLRGRDLSVMTDYAALQPGGRYRIARIDDGAYVVPEGFENRVEGGLYWSEFAPADQGHPEQVSGGE